jgi:hypothetical protein
MDVVHIAAKSKLRTRIPETKVVAQLIDLGVMTPRSSAIIGNSPSAFSMAVNIPFPRIHPTSAFGGLITAGNFQHAANRESDRCGQCPPLQRRAHPFNPPFETVGRMRPQS